MSAPTIPYRKTPLDEAERRALYELLLGRASPHCPPGLASDIEIALHWPEGAAITFEIEMQRRQGPGEATTT